MFLAEIVFKHELSWMLNTKKSLGATKIRFHLYLSLDFLLISNLTSWLRLHQFLGTKTTETNKSLKTDTNGAN